MLLVLGVNHKTTSIGVREKLAIAADQVVVAIDNARSVMPSVQGIALLSTCNRTEIYYSSDEIEQAAAIGALQSWLSDYHGLPLDQLTPCLYTHSDLECVGHIMRVACGLDSLVLGEPQILGQLKTAYSGAHQSGALDATLERVFQYAFSVAKQVRTETSIGQHPVSVAYAAVSLTKHIFSTPSELSALLVGAGEMIELVAKHLSELGIGKLTVANRTLERAHAVADAHKAAVITLEDIPDVLGQTDLVISSTASPLPIIGKGSVERVLKQRKHRPILMVDIAVPRDIEPEVAELDDVYLYTVDDLHNVIEENVKSRQVAAREAEDIIASRVLEFDKQVKSLSAVSALKMYRQKAEAVRDELVSKALHDLGNGADAGDVVKQLASQLSNKMMHSPSVYIKQKGQEGDQKMIAELQKLFGLDD